MENELFSEVTISEAELRAVSDENRRKTRYSGIAQKLHELDPFAWRFLEAEYHRSKPEERTEIEKVAIAYAVYLTRVRLQLLKKI